MPDTSKVLGIIFYTKTKEHLKLSISWFAQIWFNNSHPSKHFDNWISWVDFVPF